MVKKNISAFVWRAIFTVAYTLTVLPFTVGFFKNIASPSIKETLMLVVPLTDAHNIALPIFLAGLEFASISLACAFWVKSQGWNRALILVLLIACQSYAVTSVYYVVRARDYQTMRDTTESSKAEITGSLRDRINNLKEQVLMLSSELNGVRKERDNNSRAIRQLLFDMRREVDLPSKEAMRIEMQNREKLRERRETEITGLFGRKKSLEDELRMKEGERLSYIQAQNNGVKHKSELEFIVNEALTYESGLAGFISCLFPLSILAVAYILPKNSRVNPEALPSFNLAEHLSNAASLPKEMHRTYAKLLAPSVSAYMTALLASKTLANEGVALHLQNNAFRQIIDEAGELKGEVQLSKLDENSKNYLISEINGVMTKNLFYKEEHENEEQ